jgi:site-specific recombinase XerD
MKKEKPLVEQALQNIEGFGQSYEKFRNRMLIEQKSGKTIDEYGRKIAALSLHFKSLPEELSDAQIESYLVEKLRGGSSNSMFKHIVFGLRCYFKAQGLARKRHRLPPIKKEQKLPQVLNYAECKRLFSAPHTLKHRVLLALIYSAGLRISELTRLKIADVDSQRMLIHIRQSKNRKDRYVPLSVYILAGLRKYYLAYRPEVYLFNGAGKGKPMSKAGVEWAMREARKKAGILKEVSVHSLRHSFATHLLEMGLDILRVKELLGHSRVETTMMYLHLMNPAYIQAFSPLDKLYPPRR